MIVDLGIFLRAHVYCAAMFCPRIGVEPFLAGSGWLGVEDGRMMIAELCIPHRRTLRDGMKFPLNSQHLAQIQN